jgi:hypothetical protein
MHRSVARLHLTLAVIAMLSTVVPTAIAPVTRVRLALAAEAPAPDYQRFITFHNDFDFQIYPVIQVPADICDGSQFTNVRRIMVNGPGHAGLDRGETLTVLIPNESQPVTVDGAAQVRRCWYQSGRIYVFPVDIAKFEAAMIALDSNNQAQTTRYDDARHPRASVACFQGKRNSQGSGASGDCFTGVAQNTFAADVPAQLLEYTFDSDNGSANNDPDTGTPMADIDVSSVDDLYLPIAASVDNHGATGYMGSALDLATFKKRVNEFRGRGWPVYSAYLDEHWAGNTFSALLPPILAADSDGRALHLPGGFNSIQNTLSKASSSVYRAGGGSASYLISGVLARDTEVQPYVDRWMSWVDGNPCESLDQLIWPENVTASFDKQQFCDRFHVTMQAVWSHFQTDPTDGFQHNQATFYKDCGLTDANPDQNLTNACILQHIVGYNSQVLGGELPGQVQALLRGVAYDPQDGADQYQFDPFLTFDAPYTSQFSLNPYTRLIHSTTDGAAAVAYSFSIDDKYGNFRDAASGFIVDAGGTSALDNQQPYDPYQQYKMNWGYNRDQFSLAWVTADVSLAGVQPQLQAIAQQNGDRPLLVKQGDTLAVVGHAGGTSWKLTDPLVSRAQLQTLAQKEQYDSHGQTHAYQDAIDRLFGNATVFPASALNVSTPQPQEIALLNFDAPSEWPAGQAVLYGFIAQQAADVPATGNWVSATVCGVSISMSGPGSQRLPLAFAGGAYQACEIALTDTYGDSLTFSITPDRTTPTDTYTGATVPVWGLPIGTRFSGSPSITSDLRATDLESCTQHSSANVAGLCANVTLSAVWAVDPLARDVVYMGLDPKAMPRVNINLPASPPSPPDPNQVTWPANARITTEPDHDGKVLVGWPAAHVGSNAPLQYTLYVQDGANWNPAPGCDPSATSCLVALGATASLYVIAVNHAGPQPTQTPQLFGCYPTASACSAGAAERAPSLPPLAARAGLSRMQPR